MKHSNILAVVSAIAALAVLAFVAFGPRAQADVFMATSCDSIETARAAISVDPSVVGVYVPDSPYLDLAYRWLALRGQALPGDGLYFVLYPDRITFAPLHSGMVCVRHGVFFYGADFLDFMQATGDLADALAAGLPPPVLQAPKGGRSA